MRTRSSLTDALNRTRAAIITSRTAITSSYAAIASTAPAGPDRLTKWQAAVRAENHARAAMLPRLEALTVRDGLPLPTPTVQLARRVACPDLADITDPDTFKAGPPKHVDQCTLGGGFRSDSAFDN